jgi:hypothetical protein
MQKNNHIDTSYTFSTYTPTVDTGTSTIGEFQIWAYEQAALAWGAMEQKNIINGPYKKEKNGQLYFDI